MQASSHGYSGTPLPRKLGFKDGQAAGFVGLPESLVFLTEAAAFGRCLTADRADALPSGARIFDVTHLFTTRRAELEAALPVLAAVIRPDGMIWISWPKKASKVATDITEDTVREICLPMGLVDVKVCAVDAVWSGLKLVHRKELRAGLT